MLFLFEELQFLEFPDYGLAVMGQDQPLHDYLFPGSLLIVIRIVESDINLNCWAIRPQEVDQSVLVVRLDFDSSLSDHTSAEMHALAEFNYCALGGHLKCFVQVLHISIAIEIDDYFLEEDAFLLSWSLITRVLLPRVLLVVITVLRLICLSLNKIIISLLTLDL